MHLVDHIFRYNFMEHMLSANWCNFWWFEPHIACLTCNV